MDFIALEQYWKTPEEVEKVRLLWDEYFIFGGKVLANKIAEIPPWLVEDFKASVPETVKALARSGRMSYPEVSKLLTVILNKKRKERKKFLTQLLKQEDSGEVTVTIKS